MGRTTRSKTQCPPPSTSPNPTPWLVVTHELTSKSKPKAVEKQTFCSITPSPPDNKYKLYLNKSIPELRGKITLGCFHGWLLLVNRYIKTSQLPTMSLWNPASLEEINLPQPPRALDNHIAGNILWGPPEDEDSLFVVFASKVVYFCRPGDDVWIVQTPQIDGWGETDHFSYLFVCDGSLYGLDHGGDRLFAIEKEDLNVTGSTRIQLRFKLLGHLTVQDHYQSSRKFVESIGECCGEVYKIKVWQENGNEKRVVGAVVWRLDLAQMGWVKVKSFNGHVFFRCDWWYCASCHGATTPESDCSGGFYFLLPEDKILYFYRIEDESLMSVEYSWTTPWVQPFWVIPLYPRSLVPKETEEHSNKKSRGEIKLYNSQESSYQAHELVDIHGADQKKTEATSFCTLPQDLISLIGQHLSTFDYLNLRLACKQLYAAAPLTKSTMTALKVRNRPSSLPFLMLLNHKTDNISWDIIDPSGFDTRYHMKLPESFKGATITFSNNGWLLAHEFNHTVLFLNPFAGESGAYLQFQVPGHDQHFSSIGFSTTPTSPDCVTIGTNTITDQILIAYYRHGNEMWNFHVFPAHAKGFRTGLFSSTCPVYHGGGFYFLDEKGYLGVFQLKGEEEGGGTWRVFDKLVPMRSRHQVYSRHIVECDGNILVVVVDHMGKWVDVFRWDAQEEGWERVESLGDETIYISPHSGFSTKATIRSERGNKIYFPRTHEGRVVFYSMETRNWHRVGRDEYSEPLTGFHGTKQLLQCCWMDPSWFD